MPPVRPSRARRRATLTMFVCRGSEGQGVRVHSEAAESPQAAVADSEASRCLLTAVTRAPRPPPPGAGGGRFEAAAAEAGRVRRLGRVVGGGVAAAAAGALVRVGAVAAAGAGFLRAIGSPGAGNGQFQNPYGGVAFDAVGKLLNSTVIACKC